MMGDVSSASSMVESVKDCKYWLACIVFFLLGLGHWSCAPLKRVPQKGGSVASQTPVRVKTPTPPIRGKIKHVGFAKCIECHKDYAGIQKSKHRTVFEDDYEKRGCEICHGKGSAHVQYPRIKGLIKSFGYVGNEESNSKCLSCHKGKEFKFDQKNDIHSEENVYCNRCHRVHDVRKNFLLVSQEPTLCIKCHEKVAASFEKKYTHPIYNGRVICKNCHGIHETSGISKNNRKEVAVCINCHKTTVMDSNFPHIPVIRSCINCHSPHGSNIEKQLKHEIPVLCAACHENKKHPLSAAFVASQKNKKNKKSCLTCHDYIHGGFNHYLSSTITKK